MCDEGVLATKVWPEVRDYVRIEVYVKDGGIAEKARFRIELRTLPPALRARALATTMPCVACGQKMHPFRERGPTKRTTPPHTHLYYAACCPLSVKIGCSRSAKATEEYARVREDLRYL